MTHMCFTVQLSMFVGCAASVSRDSLVNISNEIRPVNTFLFFSAKDFEQAILTTTCGIFLFHNHKPLPERLPLTDSYPNRCDLFRDMIPIIEYTPLAKGSDWQNKPGDLSLSSYTTNRFIKSITKVPQYLYTSQISSDLQAIPPPQNSRRLPPLDSPFFR
jgi:hypothetical protein